MSPEPTRDASATTCGGACGITRERARQLDRARGAAERAYPGLVYTEAPEWCSPDAADARELDALASKIEQIVPGRVWHEPGAHDEAPSLVLFAGFAASSWWELRRAGEAPESSGEQSYVRVLFSPLGRYYTLQEIVLRCEADEAGAYFIERRHAGVVDRRMQLLVKALQGRLRSDRFVSLDAVFLSEAVLDPRGLGMGARAEAPTLRTLLFESASAGLELVTWIPRT